MKNNFIMYTILFLIGGYVYCLIEVTTRGFSHISMYIAGGLCFIIIGSLNNSNKRKLSLISQMMISSLIITVIEFITGVIVNIWLGMNVWDYSSQPYNFLGQVCLLFTNIWFFVSFFAIIMDDYLKYWLMGYSKPKYKIF